MTDEEKRLQEQKNAGTVSQTAQQSESTAEAQSAQTAQQSGTSPASGTLSDTAYERAMATLQEAEKNKPVYAGNYDEQINEIYDKIVNRDKFKYSAADDPVYKQYKDSYTQAGQQAMRDTIGQASALTGGYGSSYAQTAGQQTYDRYMTALADKIPELTDEAYDRYTAEGNNLRQQYTMLGDMRDTEYGRYRDELTDWERDRAYAADTENEAYARQQDAYGRLSEIITGQGYRPADEELSAAGMSRQEADTLLADWAWSAYADKRISADRYAELTGELPNGYKKSSGGGKQQTVSNADVAMSLVKEQVAAGTPTKDIIAAVETDIRNGALKTSEGVKILQANNIGATEMLRRIQGTGVKKYA